MDNIVTTIKAFTVFYIFRLFSEPSTEQTPWKYYEKGPN